MLGCVGVVLKDTVSKIIGEPAPKPVPTPSPEDPLSEWFISPPKSSGLN